jgi:hypothetical protein
MGWELLTYNERTEHIRDTDLLLLQHFLLRTLSKSTPTDIEADADTFTALKSYVDGWTYAGNGVILGFDPEDFIRSAFDRTEPLRKLLNRTADHVSSFGDAIPLDYLRQFNGFVVTYTCDLPVTVIYSAIGKFLKVLA